MPRPNEEDALENHQRAVPGWSQRPTGELVRLAWPVAVSSLSYSLMTLVDTIFVARLGTDSLAGVGLGAVFAMTVIVFPYGLMRGAKVRVSQAVGARRVDAIPRELGAALGVGLGLGLVLSLAGRGLSGWAGGFASSEGASEAATAYLATWCLGVPGMMAKVGLREVRYGLGDARSPMWATLAGNATNLALDPIFIFGFGWGVEGAALATVISHHAELAVLVVKTWRRGPKPTVPSLAVLRGLLAVGLPTGAQFFLEVGSFATLGVIIASFGPLDMAAHQGGIQMLHFTFLPVLALSEAASVLAGQAVGSGHPWLVRRVGTRALSIASVYALGWTVALFAMAESFAWVLATEEALAVQLAAVFRVAALFQLFDAVATVARSVLRGTGDVRVPAVIGVVIAWVCTPPLGYLFGAVLGGGAPGAWLALAAEFALAAAFLWWRLERWSAARRLA